MATIKVKYVYGFDVCYVVIVIDMRILFSALVKIVLSLQCHLVPKSHAFVRYK